jgi:DNA invertase Pin-like site-specific DNA recombinase
MDAQKKDRPRAAIYARLSKEGDSLSVQRQLRLCRESAEDRGWEVAAEFVDRGKSAYKRGIVRRGYEDMMSGLEAGLLDAVLVYNVDRLFRQDRERLRFYDAATAAGVFTVGVVDGQDADLRSADGQHNFREAGSAAEHQSARASERIRRATDDLIKEGRRWGGRRPFGYTEHMKVNRTEATIIRRGRDMVFDGATAYRVALAWNDAGSRTPTGLLWSTTRVREVLTSALIAGLREHRRTGMVYPGTWPPIITEDEHMTLRALLAPRRTGKPLVRRHVLTGVLRCVECGTRMVGRTNPDGRRSYACPSGNGGCGRVAIGANAVEDIVLDQAHERDLAYAHKPSKKSAPAVDLRALRRIAERRTRLQQVAEDENMDVSEKVRALDEEERALRDEAAVTRRPDPEKDSPDRRERRHRGDLTPAEVLQTAAWVQALVGQVKVRKATSTREPAAARLSIIWR